jgi:hypothetical protein
MPPHRGSPQWNQPETPLLPLLLQQLLLLPKRRQGNVKRQKATDNNSKFPELWGTPLSLSGIHWKSGVPTEGKRAGISEAVAARVPRRNIKEFWLTILSEAERPQIQLSEPEGRVLDLQ